LIAKLKQVRATKEVRSEKLSAEGAVSRRIHKCKCSVPHF
jgi:hypothetical protein